MGRSSQSPRLEPAGRLATAPDAKREMKVRRARRVASGKQLLLLVVAGLLSASAALAIAILLFGDFGETEGRILATTALLAGYGLLALPAAMLVDQRRLSGLAVTVLLLAAAGAALAVAATWTDEPSDAHGNGIGTISSFLVASSQVSALALRRSGRDPGLVRGLFVASSVLVAVVAVMISTLLWAGIDSERYGRVLAALVVLDVLAVALQPTLARARPRARPIALTGSCSSPARRWMSKSLRPTSRRPRHERSVTPSGKAGVCRRSK